MNPKSQSASAVLKKDLIERYFMDKYSWTPKQISELPHKWVQRYFIVENVKDSALDEKRQIDELTRNINKR